MFSITFANAQIVANLSGQLNVNQGLLSYTLPLRLPVGPGNFYPRLKLLYNQTTSVHSYYGQGWNISTLNNLGMCIDDEEKVCLNGSEIVLTSGIHLENNSTYTTKMYSGKKIVYNQADDKFTIYNRDGEILEFIKYNDMWLIDKRKNREGLTIKYRYFSNNSETRLTSILYGDTQISFEYETKHDMYIAVDEFDENFIMFSSRVKTINIKNDNTIVRKYELNYEAKRENTQNDRSKLISIQECVDEECLEPFTMTWDEEQRLSSFTDSFFLMSFTLAPMIIYEAFCKRNDYCANLPEYIHNSFLTSKIETEHFVMFFVVVIILSILARFIELRLEKRRSGKWEKERREKDFY